MSARIYYACPDCGGASAEQAERRDEADARAGVHELYKVPICARCSDRGTLPPEDMTATEVESHWRALDEDREARNRVDLS